MDAGDKTLVAMIFLAAVLAIIGAFNRNSATNLEIARIQLAAAQYHGGGK